ncbi:MAG TPA: phosphotransferase [Ktedonobacteraceae bacterium]|nr:phosphotransferase [Ktedonobacteraceae bacterium]
MQRYEDLTRAGQVRRMHTLAKLACTNYELGEISLTPLAHFFNTTFRIDNRKSGERFVVRIHRAGGPGVQAIESELHWLQALRSDVGLVVPEPVLTREGKLVTCVTTPGIPEPRQCVIFRWVDGRFLRAQLGIKEVERVGAFMATLHLHAEGYIVPASFSRPRWDYEGVCGGALGIDLAQSRRHLSPEGQAILARASQSVQQAMRSLGEDRAVFGLIHADLYERNYLFSSQEVHAIDFDGCGRGYYLFDIGVSFSTLMARSNYAALRAAFLAGYRSVRGLSIEHEALIDTFIAARLIGHIQWLAAHIEEPAYGERARKRIAYELAELSTLLV